MSDEKANKSLAEAFKNQNLAKRFSNNAPKSVKPKKEKTKEELFELRKNLMKKRQNPNKTEEENKIANP